MVFFKALLGIVLLFLVSQASSSYIHGCYLSNATNPQQQFQDFKLDTYTPNLCTHIFFSYAQIKDDFTIDAKNPGHLKWGVENKFYNQLNELKSQQPGLKTILSLDGSCDFKKMLIDNEQRQTFVQSAADFAEQFEFDGVDIDVSQTITNKRGFTDLVGEFKKSLPDKLIIVSVPADHESVDLNFDVPAIAKYSNFVNLLADKSSAKQSNFIGDQSFSNEFDSMYSWVSNGLSKNKLVVGMNLPAYEEAVDGFTKASINVKNSWMKENGFGGAFVRFVDENKIQASTVCCYNYTDQEIVNNDLVNTLGALEECCDLCANFTGCFGWVWDNYEGGTCWFKTTSGPTVTKIGSITGVFCDERKKPEKNTFMDDKKQRIEL